MSKKPIKPKAGHKKGNFIAEWFGYRVWDKVDTALQTHDLRTSTECPFLSKAIGHTKTCIKTGKGERPTGVCTISSDANGSRQDWLACPYRTLDEEFTLIKEAVHLLYGVPRDADVLILSGEAIKQESYQKLLCDAINSGIRRAFIFLADKMGGEVDIPETTHTPGTKVDVSIIEVLSVGADGVPDKYGKHLHYEIQTADFHGSPLHAVREIEELAARANTPQAFYDELSADIQRCGIGVEGPNKSNIFKRTFYQAVLKIQFAQQQDDCAGFVLVIPTAVWESWKKHLGKPDMPAQNGITALARNQEEREAIMASTKAWIFVFEIEDAQPLDGHPRPLKIVQRVGVTTEMLTHFAFEKVGQAALSNAVISTYRNSIDQRIRGAIQGDNGKPRQKRTPPAGT